MPKQKKDEDDLLQDQEHSSFMETIAASRAAQDQAAKRLEDAMMTQLKVAKEKVNKLKALEDTHAQNETDLVDARAKLKEQEIMMDAMRKENASLEEQLKGAREDARRREDEDRKRREEARVAVSERDNLQTDKDRLETELERLKSKADTSTEDIMKYRLEAEKAKGEASTLRERVTSLQNELENLSKNKDSEQSDMDAIKRLTQQLGDATTAHAALTERLHSSEKGKIEAESELKYKDSKISDQTVEIKRTQSQVEDLKMQLRDAQTASTELRSAPPPAPTPVIKDNSEPIIKELTDSRNTAVKDLSKANAALVKANSQLAELAESKAKNQYQQETIGKQKEEVSSLKADVASLKAELSSLKAELARVRDELAHVRAQNDTKLKGVAETGAVHAASAASTAATDAAKLRLQTELLDVVRKQVALAEDELDKGLADLAAKDEEWAVLQTQLRVAESKIAGLQQQVLSLSESKAIAGQEKAAFVQQIAQLREDLTSLNEKNALTHAKSAEVAALADERLREIVRLHELLKLRSEQSPVQVQAPVQAPLPPPVAAPAPPPTTLTKDTSLDIELPLPPLDIDLGDSDPAIGLSDSDMDGLNSYEDESGSDDYYRVDGADYGEEEEDSFDEQHKEPPKPQLSRLAPERRAHSAGPRVYEYEGEDEYYIDNSMPPRRLSERDVRLERRSDGPRVHRRAHTDFADYERPAQAKRFAHIAPVVLPALLRSSDAARRLKLVGQGTLKITADSIAFEREDGRAARWPLTVVKKYGDDIQLFSLEIGSISATGRGVFFFEMDQWKEAFAAVNNAMVTYSHQQTQDSRGFRR